MITPRTHAHPTRFDSARANEIWSDRGSQWSLTLTPGDATYMTAFFAIMRGQG
jgi:hypothetical protein